MAKPRTVSSPLAVLVIAGTVALTLILALSRQPAMATAGDVWITHLDCTSNPEVIRLENFGGSSQSLSGFRLQSDPVSSQDYEITDFVSSIGAGQTIEFQTGSNATDGPNRYKLAGAFILRNDPPLDWARLVRPGASNNQVNCGENPPTPPPSTPTPTPAPSPTPTAAPTPAPTPALTLPPGGIQVAWGDNDCDGDNDSVDALVTLRDVAGLDFTADDPCPRLGDSVSVAVASASNRVWGDIDCDGDVDAVDALQALRHVAALSVSQGAGCPGIGTPVMVDTSTATGALLIHHIDVEQGDGALIVSPGGETAMIDSGRVNCDGTVAYVQSLTDAMDYHFATHYDADHIGCTDDLVDAGVTITNACYDRGGSRDTQTFEDYAAACGDKRQTSVKGQRVTLDAGSTQPVYIDVVNLNGAGVTTSDENALGLVLLVSFGKFQHVFAGDLPGESPDVEPVVGPEVGDVDVCKVNHHGSKFSSTDAWLDAIDAEVCVLSVGSNGFGHPTAEALGRLHAHGVQIYWTNEGTGAAPDATWDTVVDGSVVIEVGSDGYTIDYGSGADTYPFD